MRRCRRAWIEVARLGGRRLSLGKDGMFWGDVGSIAGGIGRGIDEEVDVVGGFSTGSLLPLVLACCARFFWFLIFRFADFDFPVFFSGEGDPWSSECNKFALMRDGSRSSTGGGGGNTSVAAGLFWGDDDIEVDAKGLDGGVSTYSMVSGDLAPLGLGPGLDDSAISEYLDRPKSKFSNPVVCSWS